jgi:hypothetical protein
MTNSGARLVPTGDRIPTFQQYLDIALTLILRKWLTNHNLSPEAVRSQPDLAPDAPTALSAPEWVQELKR